jgi:hypothetical protein
VPNSIQLKLNKAHCIPTSFSTCMLFVCSFDCSVPKQPAEAPAGVFVDAITGRHGAPDPGSLLQRRCLTFDKNYGWT